MVDVCSTQPPRFTVCRQPVDGFKDSCFIAKGKTWSCLDLKQTRHYSFQSTELNRNNSLVKYL